ncbi:TadE/TadG family type IV pilus assembly protein [Devosia sp.]|uniref:TadE/TadG family type IV pilus assembly protein n=1 Tax=Devosia sp. TaxID=1871048 RepID=UPI001AFD3A5E|nr:TadE/TadG family type IV pilus assembly protein [Devosia sp.]MBO9589997.1 pilus assembly protein [Devosia sp.]
MDQLRRLLKDQQGNVAVISALMLIPMLVLAGGATDIARYEAFRAQLQDGVDRAVLAAASLSQGRTAEETVDEYLKSLAFIEEVELAVDQVDTINSKSVTVTASYNMATAFLPLIGINMLPMSAVASAEERRSNIELSLMLDLSGSMNDNGKYPALKSAATSFIQAMVTPETEAYTTVNIVPYAGQVSLGSSFFDNWGGVRSHNNSSCVELYKPDFYASTINLATHAQVPHFTKWNGSADKPTLPANMNPGWCPSDNTAVTLMSNDADALISRIAGFQMYDGTGTAIAMNWGLRFLDPALRPQVQQAVAAGQINSAFLNRPAAFDDAETLKVMVLMTDGAITEQYTAKDPNAGVRTSKNDKAFYDPYWKKNIGADQAKELMNTICATAKSHGILVFTIGFQLRDSDSNQLKMKNELRNCASSASHYYDVQGLNIAAAFQSIASTIQRIKLTQ